MACPDGLDAGFGLSPPERSALCYTKSYFGIVEGESLYVTGSALLFDSGSLRYVVTAGHNLYSHKARRLARWFDVWFQRSGSASLDSSNTTDLFVPDQFSGSAVPEGQWDFGVARLKKALDPASFKPMGLGVSSATAPTAKRLCGYPDEGACAGRCKPCYADLTVIPNGPQTYDYEDQMTYTGMSGGPLIHRESDGRILSYGIHTRGPGSENRAVRFSQAVHDRIFGWVSR